ncbi:MAG: sigma-70 family RNA polymerase sigma factor [Acidobacteria bacterium]|nr:sigma-70 family RNA polymerase sigma factor [Acidobacteriota bacterium]
MADDVQILPGSQLARAAGDCPLLEGDSEAWIVCCSGRFFPLARRIAGDDALAEDVLQVSWIKILQAINHVRFEGPKACPWVHRVVANTARDFHKKRVRRREVALEDRRDPARGPEALAQERELLVLCREMIDLLPATYRQVLKLRLYQGLSNKQISRRLHLSRGNVAVRLNRAVALLKRRFDSRIRSLSAQASQQS